MSGCKESSRWREECLLGRCVDCATSCVHTHNYNNETLDGVSERFVTVGSVRYGLRLGAVSPPPPGAGPRYRSKCCWPSTFAPGPDPGSVPVPVSRIPLLNDDYSINSRDIFSCINRVRMAESATSELSERAPVHDRLLYNTIATKSLLKNHIRRRTFVRRPELYARLCECRDSGNGDDIANNLDRLPRFRFGGNRGNSNNKLQERDKRNSERRLKEVTERLRTVPIPPPRTKHVSSGRAQHIPQSPPPVEITTAHRDSENDKSRRVLPSRSASFSQVEYSLDHKKYIRKTPPEDPAYELKASLTLPRSKNSSIKNCEQLKLPSIILPDQQHTTIKRNQTTSEESTTGASSQSETAQIENAQEKRKRDKSRRRKGIYISQWPHNYRTDDNEIDQFVDEGDFVTALVNIQSQQLSVDSKKTTQDNANECDTTNTSDCHEKNDDTANKVNQLLRADSLSEGEPDQNDRRSDNLNFGLSDISDCESRNSINDSARIPRRYSKRPLRGPYGQMLEAEMKKPETGRKLYNDLKFLEDMPSDETSSSPNSACGGDQKQKLNRARSSNNSFDDSHIKNTYGFGSSLTPLKFVPMLVKRKVSVDNVANNESDQKLVVNHQRTTSSPSKLEGFTANNNSSELLGQSICGSTEHLLSELNLQRNKDTRTHVVVELYDTEKSYVESLQILITKYLEPLKSPENSGLLDASLVDEIFFQIPTLLNHHQVFLEELKKRLEHWDVKQKVGDVFLDMFSKPTVIESYTDYVNNWKRVRDIIKNAQQSKPAFARFLESMAREHKGKLALDSLLIKPIQKFPKYELLLQRLIKHTDTTHPDHSLLLAAQKEVHEQLLKINCTEREALELEQLREIESLIEGLIELVTTDRQYVRHDLVSMAAGSGTRKERALFLFSDLLLITSIKRRSGTIRKPPPAGQGSVTSTLDANKYKLLMKIALDDLEIIHTKDENLRQVMQEISNVSEDIAVLNKINEMCWTLHCNHSTLDDVVRDMLTTLNKQLSEQQNSDSQLSCLDLTLNTTNGKENISIIFSKPDKKASWEESFNEAKHKLAMSGERRFYPKLLATVPIRKTRSGLQFTCAAPILSDNFNDVWVCNSDGYVGQVCILSLQPEPTVTSCNGVCNARILCIASVPGADYNPSACNNKSNSSREENDEMNTIQFDSSSSSDDEYEKSDEEHDEIHKSFMNRSETVSTDSDDTDVQQSTMWLGTEDGCIHVYNSSDNIRIKKNKIKLQHNSSILCIIYLNNKVFVSLANGDVAVYEREICGGWNVNSPVSITIGSTQMPVSKMLPNGDKLWCGCGNTIKVINTETMAIENSFTVNNDSNKPITCIILSGNGVWLSLQNSAIIKCFHSVSFEQLCEVNVAPAVTKMLTSCDDIIRQHKAACLRVTALLACRDLLWIGTSAGVLLTMPLPHITATTLKLANVNAIAGIPHGHTGHVRFLTCVERQTVKFDVCQQRHSYKGKADQKNSTKMLVISGGDGYEDFRNTNLSEVAGREDSTNHLLLWNV